MSDCECGSSDYRANLVLRLKSISKQLADISTSSLGGKPNVKMADGGTVVDHVGYRKSLLEEMAEIQKLIKDYDSSGIDLDGSGANDPFEFTTEVSME